MAQSVQIKNINWWHEQIFDWMITNPEKKLRDCAEYFKVSQPWLSVIIHSDVFKERFAARRDEHFSNISRDTVDRISGLADLSLDVLEERIQAERDGIALSLVKDTAEMALRASGYTGPKVANLTQNTINISVDKDVLEESRALMSRTVETTAKEIE